MYTNVEITSIYLMVPRQHLEEAPSLDFPGCQPHGTGNPISVGGWTRTNIVPRQSSTDPPLLCPPATSPIPMDACKAPKEALLVLQ